MVTGLVIAVMLAFAQVKISAQEIRLAAVSGISINAVSHVGSSGDEESWLWNISAPLPVARLDIGAGGLLTLPLRGGIGRVTDPVLDEPLTTHDASAGAAVVVRGNGVNPTTFRVYGGTRYRGTVQNGDSATATWRPAFSGSVTRAAGSRWWWQAGLLYSPAMVSFPLPIVGFSWRPAEGVAISFRLPLSASVTLPVGERVVVTGAVGLDAKRIPIADDATLSIRGLATTLGVRVGLAERVSLSAQVGVTSFRSAVIETSDGGDRSDRDAAFSGSVAIVLTPSRRTRSDDR